MNMKGTVFNV